MPNVGAQSTAQVISAGTFLITIEFSLKNEERDSVLQHTDLWMLQSDIAAVKYTELCQRSLRVQSI